MADTKDQPTNGSGVQVQEPPTSGTTAAQGSNQGLGQTPSRRRGQRRRRLTLYEELVAHERANQNYYQYRGPRTRSEARRERQAAQQQVQRSNAQLAISRSQGNQNSTTTALATTTTRSPITGTGTPATGTPATGTPAAGTSAAGTPAAGTPAAGTPATGTCTTTQDQVNPTQTAIVVPHANAQRSAFSQGRLVVNVNSRRLSAQNTGVQSVPAGTVVHKLTMQIPESVRIINVRINN